MVTEAPIVKLDVQCMVAVDHLHKLTILDGPTIIYDLLLQSIMLELEFISSQVSVYDSKHRFEKNARINWPLLYQ